MVFKDGKKVGHATGVDGLSLNVSTSCLSITLHLIVVFVLAVRN
jgi:hypothetical protein